MVGDRDGVIAVLIERLTELYEARQAKRRAEAEIRKENAAGVATSIARQHSACERPPSLNGGRMRPPLHSEWTNRRSADRTDAGAVGAARAVDGLPRVHG